MECFDSDVPLNPRGDLDKPVQIECAGCGALVANGHQRTAHQAFHDRVEPEG